MQAFMVMNNYIELDLYRYSGIISFADKKNYTQNKGMFRDVGLLAYVTVHVYSSLLPSVM